SEALFENRQLGLRGYFQSFGKGRVSVLEAGGQDPCGGQIDLTAQVDGFGKFSALDQLQEVFYRSTGLGLTPKDDPIDDDGQRNNRAGQERDHDRPAFDDDADRVEHVNCSLELRSCLVPVIHVLLSNCGASAEAAS